MKRRVAHLITRLDMGGAQRNTLASARRHDRARYEVALLAGEGGKLDGEAHRLDDVFVAISPEFAYTLQPVRDVLMALRLARWLKRSRVDVLHTHSSKAGVLGRAAARLAGVPVVVHTVHGWSFNDTQPRVQRALYVALEKLCARWSDRIIVVADTDRELGLSEGIGHAAQYQTVRSAPDLARFRAPEVTREEARARLGYSEDDVVIGAIANLKEQKDPITTLRVAERVRAVEPRAKFFLAGDGPLRPALEGKDDLRLLGWVDEVEPLYAAMDIFLLTSRFEGLPRSVVQAHAAGVPVVATAVNGTREVVEDGVSGRLAEPGDVEALAAAVVDLVRRPEERARLVKGAVLGPGFDEREMVDALDALYAELLGLPSVAGGAGGG